MAIKLVGNLRPFYFLRALKIPNDLGAFAFPSEIFV